ncbi:MAG: hypothetical protein QG570_110 [Patescibacteria group bacterium]|nr:hypothetical protein [Patescibacteria group bacterium]
MSDLQADLCSTLAQVEAFEPEVDTDENDISDIASHYTMKDMTFYIGRDTITDPVKELAKTHQVNWLFELVNYEDEDGTSQACVRYSQAFNESLKELGLLESFDLWNASRQFNGDPYGPMSNSQIVDRENQILDRINQGIGNRMSVDKPVFGSLDEVVMIKRMIILIYNCYVDSRKIIQLNDPEMTIAMFLQELGVGKKNKVSN